MCGVWRQASSVYEMGWEKGLFLALLVITMNFMPCFSLHGSRQARSAPAAASTGHSHFDDWLICFVDSPGQ